MKAGVFMGVVLAVVLGFASIAVFVDGGGLNGLGSPHESGSSELTQFGEPAGWQPVYWLGSGADTAAVAGPPWSLISDPSDPTWRAITQQLHVNGRVWGVTVVTMEGPSYAQPSEITSHYHPLTGVMRRGQVAVRLYLYVGASVADRAAIRTQALHDLEPIPTGS